MKSTKFPAGVKPEITAVITQADGTTINLVNKDFMAGSVSFKSGSSNSGEITVGGAIIPAFNFSLMNEDGKFSNINFVNATVKPTLKANGITLSMGKYWFVNHKETGNVISCESYGSLQIFDEHQLYEDNITYPIGVNELESKIADGRGIYAAVNSGVPSTFTVDDPGDDEMTERECLSYLAQMTGCFIIEDADVIRFAKYSKSKTPYDAGTTFSHDLRTEPITVTGIQVYTNNGKTPVERGSDGYRIVIQDNPFITESNVNEVADMIDSVFTGLSFYPGTFSILGNPAIEPGDMLKLQTDKQEITTLATTVTYKLQLQESITADADDYAGDMRISKKAKAEQYINNTVNKTIDSMSSDPESSLNHAINTGVQNGVDDMLADPDSGLSNALNGVKYKGIGVPTIRAKIDGFHMVTDFGSKFDKFQGMVSNAMSRFDTTVWGLIYNGLPFGDTKNPDFPNEIQRFPYDYIIGDDFFAPNNIQLTDIIVPPTYICIPDLSIGAIGGSFTLEQQLIPCVFGIGITNGLGYFNSPFVVDGDTVNAIRLTMYGTVRCAITISYTTDQYGEYKISAYFYMYDVKGDNVCMGGNSSDPLSEAMNNLSGQYERKAELYKLSNNIYEDVGFTGDYCGIIHGYAPLLSNSSSNYNHFPPPNHSELAPNVTILDKEFM